MPPKKKKATVNVVVGTVSTRSTRRQSIVNIEIPKSKRSLTKKPTAKDEKYSLTITTTSNIQTEQNEDKDLPKKIQQLRTSASERKVTKRTSTQVPRRGRSSGSLPDSNTELLRILDDWTDEEGPDRTDTSSLGYTESESSVGAVNINSGTDELKTTFKDQFEGLSQDSTVEVTNEVGIVEGIKEFLEVEAGQTEGNLQESQGSPSTDGQMIEKISPGLENEDFVIENTNSSSGMCVPDVEEHCIVEQNVIIEDSQEAKDGIQIECVTDDVIPTELIVDEESAEISQVVHNEMPQTDDDIRMHASEVTCKDIMEGPEHMLEESGADFDITPKESYDQPEEAEPERECVTNQQNDCIVEPEQPDYEEINQVLPEEGSEIMNQVQQKDVESEGTVPQEDYEVMDLMQQGDNVEFQTTTGDTPREDAEAVEATPLPNNDEICSGQMEDDSSKEQSEDSPRVFTQDYEGVDSKQIDESSQEQPGQSEIQQEYNEEIIQEFDKEDNQEVQEVLEVVGDNNQETLEVLQGDTQNQIENEQEYNQMVAVEGITVEENIQIVHEVTSQFKSNDDSNFIEEGEQETIVVGEKLAFVIFFGLVF
nr:unnamed protein product [Callosobruchus analis]